MNRKVINLRAPPCMVGRPSFGVGPSVGGTKCGVTATWIHYKETFHFVSLNFFNN